MPRKIKPQPVPQAAPPLADHEELATSATREARVPTNQRALSIEQVQRDYGFTRSHIYVAISTRKLKAVKAGRRTLILADSLTATSHRCRRRRSGRCRRPDMTYSVKAAIEPRIATAYRNAAAITPADNAQIGPFAALYVGSAGSVVVCPVNSTTVVTFVAVPAGTLIPLAFQGVNATGTTAGSLVGLG